MIKPESLTAAGSFTKTHGIHGELNATLTIEPEFFAEDSCFICDTDGIYVPYFIESFRLKGSQGVLIRPENVNSDIQAKPFVGKSIYINKERYARFLSEFYDDEDYDADGAFADDFISFGVVDTDGSILGEITDLETSTANTLFILRTPDDRTLYIPVAEEFIKQIDTENKIITVDLPEGLIDLN